MSIANGTAAGGRIAEAARFVRALWPDPPPGYYLLWQLEGRESVWFPTGGPEALAAEAVQRSGSANVYLGCALSPKDNGAHQRCEAADVSATPGLWADLDVSGPAHRKADLPPDANAALDLARAMPRPPSLAVHSGHGLQVWWLFKEPWVFADDQERSWAADLAKRWEAHLHRLAAEKGWRLDSTADLARVMRIPGTWNRKLEPVPVTLELPDRLFRYDPGELADLLPDEPAPHEGNGHAGDGPGRWQAKVPPAGEPIPEGRRNDTLTRIAGAMRRHGCTEAEMLLALKAVNRRCEPPLPEKDLETIARSVGRYPPAKPPKKGAHRAHEVILAYWRHRHRPLWRRDRGDVFSDVDQEAVRRADLLAGAEPELVEWLLRASDCPQKDGRPNRGAVPKLFRDWAPTAHKALLAGLEKEHDQAEVAPVAEEEFRRQLSAALFTIVPLGREVREERVGKGGAGEQVTYTRTENRSLIDWCGLFAKPGRWAAVRGYLLWCRLADDRLCVALRAELFGQVPGCALKGIDHERFRRLCEHYGAGVGCGEAKAGGWRVVELLPGFLDGMRQGPNEVSDFPSFRGSRVEPSTGPESRKVGN